MNGQVPRRVGVCYARVARIIAMLSFINSSLSTVVVSLLESAGESASSTITSISFLSLMKVAWRTHLWKFTILVQNKFQIHYPHINLTHNMIRQTQLGNGRVAWSDAMSFQASTSNVASMFAAMLGPLLMMKIKCTIPRGKNP